MNVKDLIEKLNEVNPQSRIMVLTDKEFGTNIEDIKSTGKTFRDIVFIIPEESLHTKESIKTMLRSYIERF